MDGYSKSIAPVCCSCGGVCVFLVVQRGMHFHSVDGAKSRCVRSCFGCCRTHAS